MIYRNPGGQLFQLTWFYCYGRRQALGGRTHAPGSLVTGCLAGWDAGRAAIIQTEAG